VKFYGHFAAGLPGLMVGFFLLSPMFVWVFERLGSWIAATIMGIHPTLLRQQLTSGLWRAAGTCSALMVGLAILVVMQTEGHSMLAGWRLPNKFPDVFILSFEGLNSRQQQKLAHTPGIRPGELMPIAISAAVVSHENIDPTGANFIPQAAMFFGIDADKAAKMIELEFRDDKGDNAPASEQPKLMAQACAELKLGRHIIITDEYRRLLGKKRGDKLTIQTPLHGNVDYTISGVVWSPGMDVMVTMFDMDRQFDQRTATSIFGSIEDAHKDFGIGDVTLFAANLEYGIDKKNLARTMERETQQEPTTEESGGDDSVFGGAMKLMGIGTTKPATGPAPNKASAVKSIKDFLGMKGMQVGDVRLIKYQITHKFEQILLLLSTVAFASMAVAALGVTNTVMASIRSRRWQFGILRSIGVTRSQLLRLVIAESLLLAITSCALGLAAGFLMSLDANGLSRFVLGYVVPLTPPWGIVGIGTLIVMATAILASLWPAISVAYDEPLALLQAGRAAA
jgi:putative ABC transport system permease protein